MIQPIFLAVVFLAGSSVQADAELCLGVAVPARGGEENLVWITVTGDKLMLSALSAEAHRIKAKLKQKGEEKVHNEIRIVFDSEVRSVDAVNFVNDVRGGKFGAAEVKALTMSIDTLPMDKCPRS